MKLMETGNIAATLPPLIYDESYIPLLHTDASAVQLDSVSGNQLSDWTSGEYAVQEAKPIENIDELCINGEVTGITELEATKKGISTRLLIYS